MKLQIWTIALGVILLPVLAVSVTAAPMAGSREFTPEAVQKYAEKAKEHPEWISSALTLDTVKKTLAASAQLMLSGRGGKPLSYGAAQIELGKIRAMAEYPFLECDSRVSRVWLQSMVKSFETLVDIRRTKLETYEVNARTDDPEYKKYLAAYQRSVRNFMAAAASPKTAVMDRAAFGKVLRLKRVVQEYLNIDPAGAGKSDKKQDRKSDKDEKKSDKKDSRKDSKKDSRKDSKKDSRKDSKKDRRR